MDLSDDGISIDREIASFDCFQCVFSHSVTGSSVPVNSIIEKQIKEHYITANRC